MLPTGGPVVYAVTRAEQHMRGKPLGRRNAASSALPAVPDNSIEGAVSHQVSVPQSVAGDWRGQKQVNASMRPYPPACAPYIRLTSERRASGWLCCAVAEQAVSCFLLPTSVRQPLA